MSALLNAINDKYKTLSKGQKRIADYIMSQYDKAAFMTASAIGKTVDVSESTVVRFASELGFSGYPELQKTMQEMVKSRLTAIQRIEVADKRIGDETLVEQVLSKDIELIRETMAGVDKAAFDGSVKAINNARKIYIIGVRSSAVLANFIAFYFNLVYDNVVLVDTSSASEIFETLFRIEEKDVCIAVTFPRYSMQIVQSLRFVAERKAKIIAITDSKNSHIASLADFVLIAKSDMVSFVDSLVAPLSLINALIVASTRTRRDEMLGNFARLEEIWDTYEVYEKDEMNE